MGENCSYIRIFFCQRVSIHIHLKWKETYLLSTLLDGYTTLSVLKVHGCLITSLNTITRTNDLLIIDIQIFILNNSMQIISYL